MSELERIRKIANLDFDIVMKENSVYFRFYFQTDFEIDSIKNDYQIKQYYNFFKLVYVLSCNITKSELQLKIDDFKKAYTIEHENIYKDFDLVNVLTLVELKDYDKHLYK